jgi:hypothetical protein
VERIKRAWRWSGQPTTTSRRWSLGVTAALIVLFTVTYSNDRADTRRQREQVQRHLLEVEYAADIAQYEAARLERIVCERLTDRRTDLRVLLLDFAELHEARGESDFVAATREILDARLPQFRLGDCPAVPIRPDPPRPLED